MSTPPMSPDEIRAAAEIHSEIDPIYRDAVIESFLDRVGKEIDSRVDRRLAAMQPYAAEQSATQRRRARGSQSLAITSIALGIPLSGICLGLSSSHQLTGLFIVWLAIAVINVAHALNARPPRPGR